MLNGMWTLQPDTGCFVWTGKRSRAGRPVVYRDGQQTPASRERWMALYGSLPRAVHLRRVCPTPDCVSPYHHVLRWPKGVLMRLGFAAETAKAVRVVLTARRMMGQRFGLVWEGALAAMECDPHEVDRLATELRCEPLLIHAAYAQLVLRGVRTAPPPVDAEARNQAVLEASQKVLASLPLVDIL